MSCNTFHLINSEAGCYAIQRGVSLGAPPANSGLAIFYPDTDVSTYTPLGQIKTGTVSSNPDLVGTLTFDPLVYGTFTLADGRVITGTKIIMQFDAAASSVIRLPPNWLDFDAEEPLLGKTCWIYDVKLIPPVGRVIALIAPSYVQVVDDVSRLVLL